jgi:spore coat polysaccharide biosynthesis protein SpsF (cytidylyltransferase family)
MNRTFAFIQARVSSSRFPGKVLAPLQGSPLIVYMVERVRRATLVDEVVVLTSNDPSDDVLFAILVDADIPAFRGSLHDVLQRFVDAANFFEATEIIRLTGDCPLIDPAVIDGVIAARREAGADYSSNVDPPTFPDGLDAECFTREALDQAGLEAKTLPEREHVTLWMRSQAAGLQRVNLSALVDCAALRLTVDYPDDLDAVQTLLQRMSGSYTADLYDMLRALAKNPEILHLNLHSRNEGLKLG